MSHSSSRISRRRVSSLAALLLGCVMSACGNYYLNVSGNKDAYFVGDTAAFVAQEQFESLDSEDGQPPSSSSPDLYSWSSADPAVAAFTAPGQALMKSAGSVLLGVSSAHADKTFRVYVLPAGAAVRAATQLLTLNVGDSVKLHADVVDSSGHPLSFVTLTSRFWSVYRGLPDAANAPVFAANPAADDFMVGKAIHPGTAYALVRLSTPKGFLGDSISIIVK